MRTVLLRVAWGALALAPACDGGGSGGPADVVTADTSDAGSGTVLTSWSPGGTTKIPKYGNACRLGTANVFEAPSNALADDVLTLQPNGGFDVEVTGSQGQVLSAAVTLDTVREGESWNDASGTATWGEPAMSGTVVAGTLCFADKLAGGTDALMEFSLVIEAADGSYHSVSGDATVPGSSVDTSSGYAISAPAIDVDLR